MSLAFLYQNPLSREELRLREKALKDKNSALAEAKAKGKAEGKAEGSYETKIASAKNLLDLLEDKVIAEKSAYPLRKLPC